jgi:hypothetical protein
MRRISPDDLAPYHRKKKALQKDCPKIQFHREQGVWNGSIGNEEQANMKGSEGAETSHNTSQ